MSEKPAVYFVPTADVADEQEGLRALEALWSRAGFASRVAAGGIMAVKMHFGDRGNHRTVPPGYVRRLGERMKEAGARVFATDTTTLYSGPRKDALGHLAIAAEHGYALETLGMPVVIADGLRGQDQVTVGFPGKHFSHCSFASGWNEIDGFLLLTHLTGHCAMGMGGALKNAAMGWASRGGKRMQHSSTRPEIDAEACTGCGSCVEHCPVSALSLEGDTPDVDKEKCIGCGQCFSICPSEAIGYDWGAAGEVLQEKVAEYATAAITPKKPHVLCITFLTRITRQCDCMGGDHDYKLPDVGIAASADPVALDAACVALCDRAAGKEFFPSLWPDAPYTAQLAHAESLGLGSREYELVEIGP
jgi:uncharacterized Fe-S center protein